MLKLKVTSSSAMATLTLLIALLLCAVIIQSRDTPERWAKYQPKQTYTQSIPHDQKQYEFNQIVDHSNYQKTSFYKQRYWVVDDYFNKNAGPVFLFICGEYVCPGVPQGRQWVITLAQRTLGLVLVLEHRYYGKSLPFGNDSLKIENMKYLTSEQALSDLAYFIQQVKVGHMYGVNNNPWITIGGSYPGAMSAWFRYKYPHLTVGSIASSAVVQSIQNFDMFDEQMYLSSEKSGDFCWQAINNSNTMVEQILDDPEKGPAFKSQFKGGDKLKDNEFLFFWIDAIVGKIQYGLRTQLCADLKGKTSQEQFQYFVGSAKGESVYEYGSYYLKDQKFAIEDGQGARSWYYQSCTEFGYWQTPSATHPLRSSRLNLDFYRQLCSDSYGEGTWPKVDRKNTETGGWNLEAFNLLMSNGEEDPWKWASILKPKGNIIARVANCQNCAHCVDLYTITSSDAPELKKIRDEQYLTIQEWISRHWQAHRKKIFDNIFAKTNKQLDKLLPIIRQQK